LIHQAACFISISNDGLSFGNGWYETGQFAPGHFYLAKNPLFQCFEKNKTSEMGVRLDKNNCLYLSCFASYYDARV